MSTVVNTWKRVAKMSLEEIVGLQLLVHCYLNSIRLSTVKNTVLCLLATKGKVDLGLFCRELADMELFTSEQGARNAISELQEMGLITKVAVNGRKKAVSVADSVGIVNTLPVMLDVKAIAQ